VGSKKQAWFEKIDRHPRAYGYGLILIYLLLNNGLNANSVWLEHNRQGPADIWWWEPWLWEYSSMLGSLTCLPLLFWWFRRLPLRFDGLGRQLLLHAVATVLFSCAHVAVMVLVRQLVYQSQSLSYDFGPLLREFWYEYRKDAWGYLFWLVGYQLANFVYWRLKGDASLISQADNSAQQPDQAAETAPQHFLVRKLDKEFLVRVQDIEWLEAAGNYVNLHSQGRIYPLRVTLAQLAEQLQPQGFSRIHRSFAVNHHAIHSISYDASGDGEILLHQGKRLNLSRRYKEEFRNRFKQGSQP